MKLILDAPSIERAATRMAHEILEKNKGIEGLVLIGIQTRGVILAQRLEKMIEKIAETDDALLEKYLNNQEIEVAELKAALAAAGIAQFGMAGSAANPDLAGCTPQRCGMVRTLQTGLTVPKEVYIGITLD